jgi:hypothetical protein
VGSVWQVVASLEASGATEVLVACDRECHKGSGMGGNAVAWAVVGGRGPAGLGLA